MAPTPQVNIRAPAESHESIRRLGELLRLRPDLAPALAESVAELEQSVAEEPGAGQAAVELPLSRAGIVAALEEMERRLEVLEAGRKPAPPRPSRRGSREKMAKKAGLSIG